MPTGTGPGPGLGTHIPSASPGDSPGDSPGGGGGTPSGRLVASDCLIGTIDPASLAAFEAHTQTQLKSLDLAHNRIASLDRPADHPGAGDTGAGPSGGGGGGGGSGDDNDGTAGPERAGQGVLYGATGLRELDLTDNAVSTVSAVAFATNTALGRLVLQQNVITQIAVGAFDALVNLVTLVL